MDSPARYTYGVTVHRFALPAAAVAVVLAAGCGSASSHPTAPSQHSPSPTVLVRAASATRRAGSARVTMDATVPSPQGTLTMRATGAFAFHGHPAGQLHATMSLPGSGTMTMDERMIGTTIYLSSPAFDGQLPGGKRWIKIDLEKAGKAQGIDFGALLSSSSGSDPTQALTYMQAAASSIQNLGTETIGGVSTTHYHAVIDFGKAMKVMVARAPASQRAAIRATYAKLRTQSGITSYPVDAWVDDTGLVRQMRMSIPTPAVPGENMDMTIGLSGFGAKVDVQPPPAAQVADLTRFAAHAQPSGM